ncbi:MAG: hypothetical protein ACRDQA_03110 [Nocardioidaceae bacterium]
MIALMGSTSGHFFGALTLPYSSSAGSTLVLCLAATNATSVPAVSDTAGNTWSTADTTIPSSGSQRCAVMYYCIGADAISSVTMPDGGNGDTAVLSEWSGIEALDNATADDQSTNPSQAMVSCVAGGLIIGQGSYYRPGSNTGSVGSGFTTLANFGGTSATFMMTAYSIEASATTDGPAFSTDYQYPHFGLITASFTPAPTGPTPGAYIYDGTDWVRHVPYVWDGSQWVETDVVTTT